MMWAVSIKLQNFRPVYSCKFLLLIKVSSNVNIILNSPNPSYFEHLTFAKLHVAKMLILTFFVYIFIE